MMSFVLVCNIGYYKVGSSCELCSGNKIKSAIGDTHDCDASCDGMMNIPNVVHISCGK